VTTPAKSAVVLLSGGMDSAVAAAIARADGFGLAALTIDYGQRHARELSAAQALARALGCLDHRVVRVDLGAIGGSSLTDARIPVPKNRGPDDIGTGIPSTYVPSRNIVFLAVAAGYAEAIGAGAVYIGANAIDYSGYPDCRPGFLKAFEDALALGTRAGNEGRAIRVLAPLLQLSKADIVRRGRELGVPFEITWSCYEGGERPCGRCDSCLLRAKGFAEAGVDDPTVAAGGARGRT